MTCILCEGEMRERDAVFCSCEASPLVKIENVPTLVCERCGEKAYTDTTIAVLEQIRDGLFASRHELVRVFDFHHARESIARSTDLFTTASVQNITLRQDGTASLSPRVLATTVADG